MTLGESRSEQARQFYNAAASASQDFAFMNYGYAPLSAELYRRNDQAQGG